MRFTMSPSPPIPSVGLSVGRCTGCSADGTADNGPIATADLVTDRGPGGTSDTAADSGVERGVVGTGREPGEGRNQDHG